MPKIIKKVEKTIKSKVPPVAEQAIETVTVGCDSFELLFKVSGPGGTKSTKAMNTGAGCIVQVTSQQRNKDGSYAIAEALTYVPGVSVKMLMRM